MPLVFPPAPAAFFSRGKEARNEPERFEHSNDSVNDSYAGLRLYPLNPGRLDGRVGRGAVPVEPLSSPSARFMSQVNSMTNPPINSQPQSPIHAAVQAQSQNRGLLQAAQAQTQMQMAQTQAVQAQVARLNMPTHHSSAPAQMPQMPHKMAPLGHLLKPIKLQQPPRNTAHPQMPMPPVMPQGSHMPQIPQMPHFAPPPHSQPIRNSQSSHDEIPPAKAAEQFRRMNNSLPDGVRYEPLDEETMRILKQRSEAKNPQAQIEQNETRPPSPQAFGARAPMAPAQTPVPPPVPQSAPLPAKASEILKRLAQDERNAFVFYSHFSKAADSENTNSEKETAAKKKEPFATLAENSKTRMEQFTTIIAQNFDENFVAQETEINTEIDTAAAITLALTEESKGLDTLGNLLELAEDTSEEKMLARALNQKMSGHRLLLAL